MGFAEQIEQRELIYGTAKPVTEPAPYDITYCPCELRPVYTHGVCKSCHDIAWFKGACADCKVAGRLPPPKKPDKPRHFGVLPPVVFDDELPKDKPNGRRTRIRTPRTIGHPAYCACGFCDPSQPKIRVGHGNCR